MFPVGSNATLHPAAALVSHTVNGTRSFPDEYQPNPACLFSEALLSNLSVVHGVLSAWYLVAPKDHLQIKVECIYSLEA